MNNTCKQCGWNIYKLDLSELQRLELRGLMYQDLKLFAIQKLKQELHLKPEITKGIIQHFNRAFGVCVRCDFNELTEENTICPKCQAFNYNLKLETSFNPEFCLHLEYTLPFNELADNRVKGFWCDGIGQIPKDMKSLLKSNLAKTRTIETTAWLGNDGQSKYDMTIKFGEQAVAYYAQNKSLIDCIPADNPNQWMFVNPETSTIEIQLK